MGARDGVSAKRIAPSGGGAIAVRLIAVRVIEWDPISHWSKAL
jgi:hypothetical protein